jgi:hypothetical protein
MPALLTRMWSSERLDGAVDEALAASQSATLSLGGLAAEGLDLPRRPAGRGSGRNRCCPGATQVVDDDSASEANSSVLAADPWPPR